MELRTRMNGGKSSLKEVADAWHREAHNAVWSQSQEDSWTVQFAKKLKDARLTAGEVKPDPRNIHDH